MMRRDLERRLRALEAAGSRSFELWIGQGDGTVRGPHGEVMTREEAEARGPVTGAFQVFMSKVDARL